MTQKEKLVEELFGKPLLFSSREPIFISRKDAIVIAEDLVNRLGVIMPPCKVGDKIYFIYPKQYQNDTIKEGVVTQLALATKFEQSMFPGESVFLFEEIGEKLFLTSAEAEQTLREREAHD